MKLKISFIILFIFPLNASFSQVIDDSDNYRQQEISCYNQILESLIQASITWWNSCTIPVPPLPLDAYDHPTKLDSLNYYQKVSLYNKEIKKYELGKITTIHISDSLFSLNSFKSINNNFCDLNSKSSYLSTRFIIDYNTLINGVNNENYKFEFNSNVKMNLILSRIYFDENFSFGRFFVKTIDLFGNETTRGIDVVYDSPIWKIKE